MKKILYTILIGVAVALTGCEDALDTNDYTNSNTSNFPLTIEDAAMLVTSMYANLNHSTAIPGPTYFMVSELASDDRLGGGYGIVTGGTDEPVSIDHFLKKSDEGFAVAWKFFYKGVAYSNLALEGLASLESKGAVSDKEQFDQMMGEAYFMRAFYYHQLGEMFERVPVILSTAQNPNSPQAEPDELYGQIGSDLKNAISLMPSKKYDAVEAGHATRWAAESLLARVWLFYTGFYIKEAMPSADGGTIPRDEVIGYLEDCITNSGHGLVGDFRNLWPYTNKYTVDDYEYTKGVIGVDGSPLLWAGNGNKEEVFAVKYFNFCGYTYPSQEGYSNYYVPFFGFANNMNASEKCFPFGGQGNGYGPVSPAFLKEWAILEPNDIRLKASILDAYTDFPEGNYLDGKITDACEETGLYGKKIIPVLSYKAYERQGMWANSIFWCADPAFDVANNYGMANWGAHFQDLILIRFADVLLMHSELTETADNMNKVRQRAGLPTVGYSLAALQKERRHELAFEGRRYSDIRRWHIAEEALGKQNGIEIKIAGDKRTMRDGKYVSRYQATRGFFNIPFSEIQLSDGMLKQNAGWDTPDAIFTSWNFD
jgi:hypothetical protein